MHDEALDIRLFGGLRVIHGGQLLTRLGRARQQALFAWLLLHADTPQSRKHVAFVFWPDTRERQALSNLRRELHHLRQAVPAAEDYLEVSQQTLCWRIEAGCTLDTTEFEQALMACPPDADADTQRGKLERAVALYQGELLAGLTDEWVEPFRQSFHERVVEALERLSNLCEQQDDTARTLACAQRLLQLEPVHEPSYVRLMRMHLQRGERALALRAFRQCRQVLAAELDARPSDAVQAVYHELREQAPPPAQPEELPLIGRRAEWSELLGLWDGVLQGGARAVVVTGEAGIGKTRLAEALLAMAEDENAVSARTRSYAAEGRLAFAPLGEWLRCPAPQANLARLDSPWLTELSRLLPEVVQQYPHLAAPEPLTQGWQRQRLFEALARAVVAGDGPTLLLFDDLQWCDRDTLEWLHYLLRFAPTAPLLLLGTLRSEEQDDNPALGELLRHLQQEGLLHRMQLGMLDRGESAALAESAAEKALDAALQERLFTATEGQPLFIVEAVRAGLDSGRNNECSAALDASPRVQAVIGTRLAQLSETAHEVAQLAATMGRAFDAEVLRTAGELHEQALAGALDELWQRSIIRERRGVGGCAASYDFSHDRLREGAYAQLSPARCRLLHLRVARALESLNSEEPGRVSAELAAQYEQAGESDKAVGFYQLAVERANDISASQEAMRLARRALALLEQRPDGTERDRRELGLLQSLSTALIAARGYTPPELEAVLDRALRLAEALDDRRAIVGNLGALVGLHIVRGNVPMARSANERALSLAEDDTKSLTQCHMGLGGLDVTEGKLADARSHFATANRLYRRHAGARHAHFFANVGVFSLTWGAHGLWLQGEIGHARDEVARAEAIAAELEHPFTSMQAGAYNSIYWQLERNVDAARATAEATVAGCDEHNMRYYREVGVIIGGWTQAMRADADEGAARIRRGLDALRAQNAFLRRPYYLYLLAELRLAAGDANEASALLDAAMSMAQQNRDLWWLPELWRLRGCTETGSGAETAFRRALEIADQQGSRSLALRAATSLAGWLQDQDRAREAIAQLEPICNAFPASLDSNNLTAARALLDQLA